MVAIDVPVIGSAVTLTGDQIYTIRRVLNESQAEFARRFAVSQPQIYRLESKRNELQSGPLIILIDMLAKQYRVNVKKTIDVRRTRGRQPSSSPLVNT